MKYAILLLALAPADCGKNPPGDRGPDFCRVEEPRVFEPGEIDWRAAHAPQNLRLDIKTNQTGARECGWARPE